MDQKNLFLAIGLSIAIIVVFQFLFPQQTMMSSQTQQSKEEIQFETSIDQEQQIDNTTIKTKEEVLSINNRVIIEAPSIKGSINLKGAILDDLVLSNYKESLKENSKHINLLSPEQTSNPYYIEIGWKTFSKNNLNIEFPNLNTTWKTTSKLLSPSTPVTLYWTNKDNITFKIHYEVDDDYMFQINQEIENNSNKIIGNI